MRRPEPKVTLQVLWQSEDTIRVTPFKEGSMVESTVKTSRTCPFHSSMVAERAREVLAILARANAGEANLLAPMQAAGRAIWTDLLPDFLKQKLAEAQGSNLVLHLDRPLLGIPWELLHDGDDFLGRRFRMGRLVTGEERGDPPMPRDMAAPLSVLLVADPCGDLPAARREAAEVEAVLEASPGVGSVTVLSSRVTVRALRDELGRHDVLHYAGHADDVDGRGSASLRMHDGPFPARLLEQLRGRVTFPGLVFLNACGSADAARSLATGGDLLASGAGLASAFLLAGTRHVVGTLWELRDEVARRFATGFYRSLGRGDTVGGAMASARRLLESEFGPERMLWADHLLYGDPTWAPAPADNLSFEDFDVLDGLEAKHREELLSADGPTRLRAAAMLLRLGDRSVGRALLRDWELLLRWLSPQANRQEARQATFVVKALAAAAGLEPSQEPDGSFEPAMVRSLIERLLIS